MMTEMGRASAVHPDELVFALLKNAHATLCYDGQNFFDNDHPVYEKVDGTGQSTTVSIFSPVPMAYINQAAAACGS